jgi:uncharacterized lipoprotein YddW (UPF0748 family)
MWIRSRLWPGRYNAVVAQVLIHGPNGQARMGPIEVEHFALVPARDDFDPLAYLCTQAHTNGIEVHAWLGGSGGAMYRV